MDLLGGLVAIIGVAGLFIFIISIIFIAIIIWVIIAIAQRMTKNSELNKAVFKEFTPKELKKYNSYNMWSIVFSVLACLLVETVLGFIVFIIVAIIFGHKASALRSEVYQRYLKRTEKHTKAKK